MTTTLSRETQGATLVYDVRGPCRRLTVAHRCSWLLLPWTPAASPHLRRTSATAPS